MRGLSAVEGSWNTTETTLPIFLRRSGVRLVTSSPSKYTCPEVGDCRPHMTLAVVDLPQPDSPTMPMTSPGMSFRETSCTACTRLGCMSDPVRVLKVTEMSSRKMIGVCSLIYSTSCAGAAAIVSRYGVMPFSLR